jgi:NADH-quinone oxidoreductase subunit J
MINFIFPLQEIIFYAFAAMLVFSAAMVVLSRNTVHSALFLVVAFFASAGLWLLVQAEFLALILVLVYVGAVMTLFLFVVMTLNLHAATDWRRFLRYLPLGLLVVVLMAGMLIYVVAPLHLAPVTVTNTLSNTEILGHVLYTQYAYPFEIAGVLLLIAIIAAISLSAPVQRNRKIQKISEQISVRREDRIRLVDMPSAKKRD